MKVWVRPATAAARGNPSDTYGNSVNLFCDADHSDPTNSNDLFRLELEGVQCVEGPMASFNDRVAVTEQLSRQAM